MAEADDTPITKGCSKCKGTFPATKEFFNSHKMGKYGLDPACKTCKKAYCAELRARPDQKARQQAWRDTHKAEVKAYNEAYRAAGYKSTAHVASWRAKHLHECREYDRLKMRRYRAANPDKYRERAREYARVNRAEIAARNRRRYRTDKWFNLRSRIQARLRGLIKGKGVRSSSERIFGFTRHELIRHIERQFTKGMSWERLLAGEIDIDHIVPVRAFDIREVGDAEFRACWALGNLRPMWAQDNRRKSGKVLTLL